ncbi:MAG TPA: META domain-containing protein [Planctomycetota bacterium]|nr:META domain-containing protein [Planctomycetota bacterium]
MRHALALGLLAAAGCGATAGARWDEVQGTVWVLLSMEGTPPLAGTETTLTLDVGRLYGQAVNRYSAQYERTEGAFQIDAIAATKKFLDDPPGAMAQEARYLKLLDEVDGWRMSGSWLELLRGETTVLVFRRRNPPE